MTVQLDVSRVGMLKCYCIDTNTLRALRCSAVRTEAELADWSLWLRLGGFAQDLKMMMRVSMTYNAIYCLRALR